MKYLLLAVLFVPTVVLALKQKKRDLYLLMAFAGILPYQFAIDLHEKLPLISGFRLLILLAAVFWLIMRIRRKDYKIPVSLTVFFGVNLLIAVINLRFGMDGIMLIFRQAFERLLLVLLVADMIEDREEFHRCIDFMIYGCVAVSIIGIVQTLFEYDISSTLILAEAEQRAFLTERMGLVRAYGTSNAIEFACYGCVMALLIVYRQLNEKSWWYPVAFAINAVTMFLTLTRSAWLVLIAVLGLMLVVYRKKLVRKLLPSLGLVLALLVLFSCFQPNIFVAISETVKSTANAVLNVVLPEGMLELPVAPDTGNEDFGFDVSEDFGLNDKEAPQSRMVQWSALGYMVQQGHGLLGYGYNAFSRGNLHYYWDTVKQWRPARTIDVGFVSLATDSGLLGFAAMLAFLIYVGVISFRDSRKKDKNGFYTICGCFVFLYVLLNVIASYVNLPTVWLFFGLFYAYRKLDKQGLLEQGAEQ